MNPRKMFEFTEEENNLMNNIMENGYRLSSDVFEKLIYVDEEPIYVEIAKIVTYDYNSDIYYFRIVTGKVVEFKKLSR